MAGTAAKKSMLRHTGESKSGCAEDEEAPGRQGAVDVVEHAAETMKWHMLEHLPGGDQVVALATNWFLPGS